MSTVSHSVENNGFRVEVEFDENPAKGGCCCYISVLTKEGKYIPIIEKRSLVTGCVRDVIEQARATLSTKTANVDEMLTKCQSDVSKSYPTLCSD